MVTTLLVPYFYFEGGELRSVPVSIRAGSQLTLLAKRRLELEAAAPQDLQDGDWTPKKEMASRSHTAATAPTPNPIARKSLFERSRCDTSLGLLTQRFAEMLSRSADGVLDLNLPYSSFVQVSSKDYAIHTCGVDIISSLPSEPPQHSSPVTVSPVAHMHTSLQPPPGAQQSFITLNPPLAFSLGGEEYSLSLTDKEGISNHFSCFDPDQTTPDMPLL
uniref:transcription factor E2F3 n=1 Tax=Gasterosteus aculeatus aculeatus TaxID=481459 RepID=UPI001A99F573|nr:transcription factor E2F3 [Gasterosteus aculeatus aculeatus]